MIENLSNPEILKKYRGEIKTDYYGRQVPKHAHGTINLSKYTSSTKLLMKAVDELFERIVNKDLLVRRVNIVASHVIPEDSVNTQSEFEQLDLFTDYESLERKRAEEEKESEKERKLQQAILAIQKKHGKNALLKGMNLEEGAMTRERNCQIGGHRK